MHVQNQFGIFINRLAELIWNVSELWSMFLYHLMLILRFCNISILVTMRGHFAPCHVWSDDSMTQLLALVQNFIVLHHLWLIFRYSGHHRLRQNLHALLLCKSVFSNHFLCCMLVVVHIDVWNMHWLLYKLYLLTCFIYWLPLHSWIVHICICMGII